MDKEFIKFAVSPQNRYDDRLIREGDFIDSELVDILCSAPISNIKNAFVPSSNNSKQNSGFKMELICPKCGNIFVRSLSKSAVLRTIRFMILLRKGNKLKDDYQAKEHLLCDDCLEIEHKNEDIERQESLGRYKRNWEVSLNNYIQSYINPNNSFKTSVGKYEKEDSIMYDYVLQSSESNERIKNAVLSLSYYDFLRTPYWDGVRNYKLRRSGYKCELCGSTEILNVYHKTYENHGLEHLRGIADKDLIVLCKNCHQKFHDKLSDKEQNV